MPAKAKTKINGLPKVGDKVIYRDNKKEAWEEDWKVVDVGNQDDMTVTIENRTGKQQNISAFSECAYFLPPKKELPKELQAIYKLDNIDVVRNLDKRRYRNRAVYNMLCRKCMCVYKIREGYIEEAELIYDVNGFRSGKPQIIGAPDGVPLGIICECTIPENLDVEYESWS